MSQEVLDKPEAVTKVPKRKDLVPKWIRFFSWIFLITGVIGPLTLLMALSPEATTNLALYGMQTTDPTSAIGLILVGIFTFKGVVSFGLIWGKKWAVDLAIVDGIVGILVCILVFTVFAEEVKVGNQTMIPFEPIPLGFFLFQMFKIRPAWKSFEAS